MIKRICRRWGQGHAYRSSGGIGQNQGKHAVRPLMEALLEDEDRRVQQAMLSALEKIGVAWTVEPLAAMFLLAEPSVGY